MNRCHLSLLILLINYWCMQIDRQKPGLVSTFDLLESAGCSGFWAFISDIRIWRSSQDAGSRQHQHNTRCQNLTSTPQCLEFISEFAWRMQQVFNVLTAGKIKSQVLYKKFVKWKHMGKSCMSFYETTVLLSDPYLLTIYYHITISSAVN